MVYVWIWLAATVVFMLLEAATAGLTSIWFAIGAFAAFIIAVLKGEFWLQIIVFAVISLIAVILTRPLSKKFIDSRKKATNADRVFSMVGIVTEEINNISAKGAVTVDGKEWTARSLDGSVIPVNTYVRPVNIEGVKLIVSPVTDNECSENANN